MYAALEAVISWGEFSGQVPEIGRLSRPNPTANLVSVQGEATNRRDAAMVYFIMDM